MRLVHRHADRRTASSTLRATSARSRSSTLRASAASAMRNSPTSRRVANVRRSTGAMALTARTSSPPSNASAPCSKSCSAVPHASARQPRRDARPSPEFRPPHEPGRPVRRSGRRSSPSCGFQHDWDLLDDTHVHFAYRRRHAKSPAFSALALRVFAPLRRGAACVLLFAKPTKLDGGECPSPDSGLINAWSKSLRARITSRAPSTIGRAPMRSRRITIAAAVTLSWAVSVKTFRVITDSTATCFGSGVGCVVGSTSTDGTRPEDRDH